MSANYDDFRADFAQFDSTVESVLPTKFLTVADIPPGDYEFKIISAKPERVASTNEAIIRFALEIGGVSHMAGTKFDRTYFFRGDNAVSWFSADLTLLGLPSADWNAANGKSWSVEMLRHLPLLAGRAFRGSVKVSAKGYHNLSVKGLIAGPPPAVAMPMSSPDYSGKDGLPF